MAALPIIKIIPDGFSRYVDRSRTRKRSRLTRIGDQPRRDLTAEINCVLMKTNLILGRRFFQRSIRGGLGLGRYTHLTAWVHRVLVVPVEPARGIFIPEIRFRLHGGDKANGLGTFDMDRCYIPHTFR